MRDIGHTIVDRNKRLEYFPSDNDMSFDYEDTYGYLYIHVTNPVDTNFPFHLIGSWTNYYFSLPDGNTIDSNYHSVKVYSFNGENYSHNYLS
jgi:hypothetical protein